MDCVRWMAGLLVVLAAGGGAQATAAVGGDILQLGFRSNHRCTLHAGGTVDCVSESRYLGAMLGGDAVRTPRRVIAGGATALSVHAFASCAIVGGALDCWRDLPASDQSTGRSGHIITTGVSDVSVGEDHACAVAGGAALCWGHDFHGQIGHNDGYSDNGLVQNAPWRVIAAGVTGVAAGGEFSCAIVSGALQCWGETGLAGPPRTMGAPVDQPLRQVFARGVSAVAAGRKHGCAIVEGAVWCWGDNSRGQVGLGQASEHARLAATTPAYDPRVRGTFPDGAQTCWWQDWRTIQCRVEHPVKVIDRDATAVWANGDETCARADHALWCWGDNRWGQLGLSTGGKDVLKPTLTLAGAPRALSLDAAGICVVMSNGNLTCTRPCTWQRDAPRCDAASGFVAGDPHDRSGIEARVGVWRGRIGDAKVMVWLARPDHGSMYYYLRHRFSIALDSTGNDAAQWNEAAGNDRTRDAKPAARWNLGLPIAGRMTGTWSAVGGTRQLPIELERVATLADEAAASVAFETPRTSAQRHTVGVATDGSRTTTAFDGDISVTELPPSLPHAAAINAGLRQWFNGEIGGHYACAFTSFNGIPDYNSSTDIDLVALPWVVMRHTWSGFCGEAHPSASVEYTLWNLDTGKTAEPWDFLKDSYEDDVAGHCSDPSACQRAPSPDLRAILIARYQQDNVDNGECKDALDAWPNFDLHPEPEGLVFSTQFAFVQYACNEDITLDWKTLAPFLTAAGKAAAQDFLYASSQSR